MKTKIKFTKQLLSIILCLAMLLSNVHVTAFAAQTDTRTVYIAFGGYNDSVDTYVLSCMNGDASEIGSVTCATTVDGRSIAALTTDDPVYLKAEIPSGTVSVDIRDAENTGLYSGIQLSADNVYVLSYDWESVTYAAPETLKVYTGYSITVAEGETAVFVGDSFSVTNYGTILAGYFSGGLTNHGVLTGGYYSGGVTNSVFGVIEGGSYSYYIKNSGKITDGVFTGYNSYYDEEWATVIYNLESGDVSAIKDSGAIIIESVDVTVNFENLTFQKDGGAAVSESPYTDKTTPGEDYSFTLTAGENYAMPDSITITIGGVPMDPNLFVYYVSEDSKRAEVYIGAEMLTGDMVISAAGYEPVTAPVTKLTVGDTLVADKGIIKGPVSGAGWSYDVHSNTLTLTDAAIAPMAPWENHENNGIYCDGNLNLAVNGTNTISVSRTDSESNLYGINITGNLYISGTGTLSISTGDAADGYCYGIDAGESITVDGPALDISSGNNNNSMALSASDFTLTSGSVSLCCGEGRTIYDFCCYSAAINGGTLTLKKDDTNKANIYCGGSWSGSGTVIVGGKECVIVSGYLCAAGAEMASGTDLDLTGVSESACYPDSDGTGYVAYVPEKDLVLSDMTVGKLTIPYTKRLLNNVIAYKNGEISAIVLMDGQEPVRTLQLVDGVWSCEGSQHTFGDWGEYCTYCDAKCPHTDINEEGFCTVCGKECPHDTYDENGRCTACGALTEVTVIFDYNGGTYASYNADEWDEKALVSLTWGDTVTLGAGDFAIYNDVARRDGYKLIDWNSEANGTGTDYGLTGTFAAQNMTIYAQWEKCTHENHTMNGCDCGLTDDTIHVGIKYVDNGNGTHDKACTCGKVIAVNEAHTGTLGAPVPADDGTKHMATWSCCGTTVTEDHTLTYTVDGNTITVSCSANCGYSGSAAISATGKTYDGNAVEVVVSKTGSLENTIIPVTLTKDGEAFTGEPVNAGAYAASVTLGDKNVSVDFTITKAEVSITADPTPKTLTYTGDAQNLISAGEAVGGTMVYSLTENGGYYTTIPQGINAGDYTVWYYVHGNANHNDSAKDSVSVNIKKATPKAEDFVFSAPTDLVYDGTAKPATITVKDGIVGMGEVNVIYFRYAGTWINNEREPIYPGRYKVGIWIKEGDNYKAVYSDERIWLGSEFEIKYLTTDAKAVISGTVGSNGWYTSDVTLTAPEGYQISKTKYNDGFVSELTFSAEQNETITYYLKDANGDVAEKTATLKIDKTAPAAQYQIGTDGWKQFINTITFGLFCKDYKTVDIEYTDELSGVAEKQYYISSEEITNTSRIAWLDYTDTLSLNATGKYFIYMRVVDNAGHEVMLNTEGIVIYEDSVQVTESVSATYKAGTDKSVTVELKGNTISKIVNGSTTLTAGTDYTISADGVITLKASYLDELNAGEYTFTVSYNPQGVETDKVDMTTTFTVKVEKADSKVSNLNISGKTYDGTAITAPTFDKLGDGAATIEYKVKGADDSTYTTTAPSAAGDYVVRVSVAESENYKAASATTEFSITPADIKDAVVTLDKDTFIYDGQPHKPAVTVTFNGATLTEGVDYEVLYLVAMKTSQGKPIKWFGTGDTSVECINANNAYYAVVMGKANYYTADNLTLCANFVIEKATVTEPTIASKPYSGSAQTADISDTDLYIVEKNNGGTEKGSYDVVLKLKDSANYKWSTTDNAEVTLQFVISAAQNTWDSKPSISGWTYGGAAKTPVGTAKYGAVKVVYTGKANDGTDYNSETAPTKAGNYTATFTVTGTEDYSGLSEQVNFIIVKADQAAPIGIGKEDETIFKKADGKITGVDFTMEYRTEGESTYTAITGSGIENLADGKYYVRVKGDSNYAPSPDVEVTVAAGRKLTVTLPQTQVGYTLTVDKTEFVYNDSLYFTFTLHDGYTMTDDFSAKFNDMILPVHYGNVVVDACIEDIVVSVEGIADITPPAAEIKITNNSWTSFWNNLTFGLFFKETQEVIINADDAGSGVESVQYYLSDRELERDEVNTIADWVDYNGAFKINPDNRYVIYTKVTDNAGNVEYINSQGIVLDGTEPMLYGIENGGVYHGDKVFKAMDENFLKIEVDGVDITDTTEGDDEFKIVADNAEHTVTVTDKAGNDTEYKITVYKKYMVTYTNGDGGSYEKEFKYGEVITIPTNEIFEDTFRKTGHAIKEWQGYTEGMTMPLKDLTFTAVYAPCEYTVTFEQNGGKVIDPITVTFGEKYGSLPASAITGLSGGNKNWYLVDADGNVTETNIKNLTLVSTTRDHKLFIKRNVLAPRVSIALTVPGGISDSYQYYIPGASQRILTADVGNMNTDVLNYTYQWYKDGIAIVGATSNVLTLDGNVSDNGTYKVEVTATLKDDIDIVVTSDTAKASKEQKVKILHAANTLSYDANGGEGGPQSSYTGGTGLSVSKDVPTRVHHEFMGWNTAPDGTGDSYKAEDAYTFVNDNGNGGCEVTLYAQWKLVEYTVTYMAEGESVSAEKVGYGKDAILPAVPVKDGFVGKWDSDGKNITGDTTISAVYTEIPMVKPDEVKPEDKAKLEDIKVKLEEELKDGGYTEHDKKDIQDALDAIDDALEVIGNVEAVEDAVSKLPAVDIVKPDDEEAIKVISSAQTAYSALSDYEKSLVDEAAKATLDKLAAALVAYDIIEGDGSSWTEDSDGSLTFIANGLFSKFVGIKVDGKDVDKADYEAKAGSTIITLKASYLDTLKVGAHTITVVYNGGSADGTFNITAKTNSPATGDNSNLWLWAALLFVSGGAVITRTVVDRKRKTVK